MLFKKYNRYRKEKYFNNPLFEAKKKYACIGIGMHSLSSIYPVLRHFNLPLKYICTKNSNWSQEVSGLFPDSIFTNDLSVILSDTEVEGVFVCASANEHFSLVNSLLKAGKKVFVEKPPCTSLPELETLIAINSQAVCKVGLQRRYWPGNKYVLAQTSKTRSYLYQFYFGSYPQGNAVYELFIHAVDYCVFLFGDLRILSTTVQKDREGISLQLHVQHTGGIAGMIELSTHGSWNEPVESMRIECAEESLTVQYPTKVEAVQKPSRILNIPAERLYRHPVITKNYFSASRLIVPAFDLNTLVLQGFCRELETFISIVESGKPTAAANDLIGLMPVYKILEELQKIA